MRLFFKKRYVEYTMQIERKGANDITINDDQFYLLHQKSVILSYNPKQNII